MKTPKSDRRAFAYYHRGQWWLRLIHDGVAQGDDARIPGIRGKDDHQAVGDYLLEAFPSYRAMTVGPEIHDRQEVVFCVEMFR